mgnify:CR=1 FL=1
MLIDAKLLSNSPPFRLPSRLYLELLVECSWGALELLVALLAKLLVGYSWCARGVGREARVLVDLLVELLAESLVEWLVEWLLERSRSARGVARGSSS